MLKHLHAMIGSVGYTRRRESKPCHSSVPKTVHRAPYVSSEGPVVFVCVCTCVYVWMHVCACAHMCMLCAHVCVCVCVCVCVHIGQTRTGDEHKGGTWRATNGTLNVAKASAAMSKVDSSTYPKNL